MIAKILSNISSFMILKRLITGRFISIITCSFGKTRVIENCAILLCTFLYFLGNPQLLFNIFLFFNQSFDLTGILHHLYLFPCCVNRTEFWTSLLILVVIFHCFFLVFCLLLTDLCLRILCKFI